MSVRQTQALQTELSELRRAVAFYQTHTQGLMKQLTEAKAAAAAATPLASWDLLASVQTDAGASGSTDEYVGLSVGQGISRELWLAQGDDEAWVKMAYDLHKSLCHATQPCEHSTQLSVGLLQARAVPRANGNGAVVHMRMMRNGQCDKVKPITVTAAWHDLRLADG